MESEKYEEAVRDYELLCRKDRYSRGMLFIDLKKQLEKHILVAMVCQSV